MRCRWTGQGCVISSVRRAPRSTCWCMTCSCRGREEIRSDEGMGLWWGRAGRGRAGVESSRGESGGQPRGHSGKMRRAETACNLAWCLFLCRQNSRICMYSQSYNLVSCDPSIAKPILPSLHSANPGSQEKEKQKPMCQTWTCIQRNGPNHLAFRRRRWPACRPSCTARRCPGPTSPRRSGAR